MPNLNNITTLIFLLYSYQDDACIYMLLTLIQGGELLNIIQGGILPESAAKFYAASIAEGLTYMHRRHILYRDLKPENGEFHCVYKPGSFFEVCISNMMTNISSPFFISCSND